MQTEEMNSASGPPRAEAAGYALTEKWGAEVVALGYTAVPDVLLANMDKFRLKPMEFAVLVQLLRYWWRADQMPFPSKRSLAAAIGCSEKTVQMAIVGLERGGGLRRVERRRAADRSESNLYDLRPLVQALRHEAVLEAGRRARGECRG